MTRKARSMSRKQKQAIADPQTSAQIEARRTRVDDLREQIEYRKSELRMWFANERRRNEQIARRELRWGRQQFPPHAFITGRSAELRRLEAELATLVS